MSALCARFGISRDKGYKWLKRYQQEGAAGLCDRSRKPLRSPLRTHAGLESTVIAMRCEHPAWGGRKIRAALLRQGHETVPAASTISGILRRHGLIDREASRQAGAFRRFEHVAPNNLWQMDFKGHFAMVSGRCHPLTVLDDHSRFSLDIGACSNEGTQSVKDRLTRVFHRYGLPARMTMDNGSPWGSLTPHGLTPLNCWLIQLGIKVSHSRPYHPQTQGKDERFHRSLNEEVISRQGFTDLGHCQRAFDRWRDVYNLQRPHEALNLDVPASRYRPSNRQMPKVLPDIEYDANHDIRMVQHQGLINYKGGIYSVPKALKGLPVGLRQTDEDGIMDVIFCHQKISQIELARPKS